MEDPAATPRWAVLTNHGHALLCVATDPDARVRDIAEAVGITQRTALAILRDLEAADYISRTRIGRRNRYVIHEGAALHHHVERGATVGELLNGLRNAAGCKAIPPPS